MAKKKSTSPSLTDLVQAASKAIATTGKALGVATGAYLLFSAFAPSEAKAQTPPAQPDAKPNLMDYGGPGTCRRARNKLVREGEIRNRSQAFCVKGDDGRWHFEFNSSSDCVQDGKYVCVTGRENGIKRRGGNAHARVRQDDPIASPRAPPAPGGGGPDPDTDDGAGAEPRPGGDAGAGPAPALSDRIVEFGVGPNRTHSTYRLSQLERLGSLGYVATAHAKEQAKKDGVDLPVNRNGFLDKDALTFIMNNAILHTGSAYCWKMVELLVDAGHIDTIEIDNGFQANLAEELRENKVRNSRGLARRITADCSNYTASSPITSEDIKAGVYDDVFEGTSTIAGEKPWKVPKHSGKLGSFLQVADWLARSKKVVRSINRLTKEVYRDRGHFHDGEQFLLANSFPDGVVVPMVRSGNTYVANTSFETEKAGVQREIAAAAAADTGAGDPLDAGAGADAVHPWGDDAPAPTGDARKVLLPWLEFEAGVRAVWIRTLDDVLERDLGIYGTAQWNFFHLEINKSNYLSVAALGDVQTSFNGFVNDGSGNETRIDGLLGAALSYDYWFSPTSAVRVEAGPTFSFMRGRQEYSGIEVESSVVGDPGARARVTYVTQVGSGDLFRVWAQFDFADRDMSITYGNGTEIDLEEEDITGRVTAQYVFRNGIFGVLGIQVQSLGTGAPGDPTQGTSSDEFDRTRRFISGVAGVGYAPSNHVDVTLSLVANEGNQVGEGDFGIGPNLALTVRGGYTGGEE